MEKTGCRIKKELAEAGRPKPVKQPFKEGPPEPAPADDSGLVCWWCVHALPQRPCIHLPIKYDERLDRFSTIGNFCSWACARAYALDMGTARSGEIQSILAMMRRRALGKFVPLWPAPKRQALACFGGTMSIEEFRSFGGHVEPPQVHWPFEHRYVPIIGGGVAGRSRDPVEAPPLGASGRLEAIENASAETDSLKLRRTKPLARSTSKLENVLGIKRTGKV